LVRDSYERLAAAPGGLAWSVERRGDLVVGRLRGDLDLHSVAQFEAAVADVTREPCRRLAIDLRGLEFIDSSGLHAIARLPDRLPRGSELVLVRGRDTVHRTFEIVGLDQELVFVDALD
jgi:anti-sigma B factor antagonist